MAKSESYYVRKKDLIKGKLHPYLARREFSYSECIIPNSKLTSFGIEEVNTSTQFSRNIKLAIPLVSSPMDTVTESALAIGLALLGGIGVIHYNLNDGKEGNIEEKVRKSIPLQYKEAYNVKNFENGFLDNPITFSPEQHISEIVRSGGSTIPVTDNGKAHGRLLGIVKETDYSIKQHGHVQIKERMVSLKELRKRHLVIENSVLNASRNPLVTANNILLENRGLALAVVDNYGNLVSLVTRTDIDKNEEYPYATKGSDKRLKVACAIEVTPDGMERIDALRKIVDAFVIDTAHCFTSIMKDMVRYCRKVCPDVDVIAGNISTAEAVEYFFKLGVDAIRIGTGPGSACKTIEVTGTGRAQGSAVWECAQTAKSLSKKYGKIYCIADGGAEYGGDCNKAIALGADTVMFGRVFARANEAPGQRSKDPVTGEPLKSYRGMGSEGAMNQGNASARYSVHNSERRVAEGIEDKVSMMPLSEIVAEVIGGIRKGMFNAGCKNIPEMHKYARIYPLPPKK